MTTVSSFSVAPQAFTASGTAQCPEPAKLALFARSDDEGLQGLARAASPEFPAWLSHVKAAADCAKPMRLNGTMSTVDTATGRVMSTRDTAHMPDGVIYKRCGNRRGSVCPSCSKIYQRDAYQIVRAGIIGGKGIPATVAQHPAMFSTFTAPSFGAVHHRIVKKHTCEKRNRCDCRAEPCHANNKLPMCGHGVPEYCYARHERDDARLGKPLCMDCYDYEGHVVWNNQATELWRRTKQAIDRELKKICRERGIPTVIVGYTSKGKRIRKSAAKASCGKAAEFQARAAVHFHALVRLDGQGSQDPKAIVVPPSLLAIEDLERAIVTAVRSISFVTAPHPANLDKDGNPQGWLIAWGEQQDNKPITLSGEGEVTDSQVAGYIAKYATKSTEVTGHTSARIKDETIDWYADESGGHAKRLVAACWRLGAPVLDADTASELLAFLKNPELVGSTAPKSGSVNPRRCNECGHWSTSTRCRVCLQPKVRIADEVSRMLFRAVLLAIQAGELVKPEPAPYAGLRRWAHMLGYGDHFFSQSAQFSVRFRILREARATFRRNEISAPDTAKADEDQAAEQTTVVVRTLAFAGTGWHTTADAQLAQTSVALAREHQHRARLMMAAIEI